MEFHRAKVLLRGTTLIADTEVGIEEFHGAGPTSWLGAFTEATHTELRPGETYWLVLDDGRSGQVFISQSSQPSKNGMFLAFRGCGALM